MAQQIVSSPTPRVGDLIKDWRARRRMSQLDLALEAGVSQRHLSFVESGRSSPSRDMVEMLCEHLDLPLRERNVVLLSAGFAPSFAERKLSDPSMAAARKAVELVLKGHEPNPALAVDRWWNLVMANAAVAPLLSLVEDKSLLEGTAQRAAPVAASGRSGEEHRESGHWKAHVLWRLGQQIHATHDPKLIALEKELAAYPAPPAPRRERNEADAIALNFELNIGGQMLSFITTTTIFGTPADVTLSELAVEAFFPANAETAAIVQAMTGGRPDLLARPQDARHPRQVCARQFARRIGGVERDQLDRSLGLPAQHLGQHFAITCPHHDTVAPAHRRARRNHDAVAAAIDRLHRVARDLQRIDLLVARGRGSALPPSHRPSGKPASSK